MERAMASVTNTLRLAPADDFHHHFRDGAALAATVHHAARRFRRCLAMPNLQPPVTTTAMALAYRRRIVAALPEGAAMEPLMTLYLTDETSAADIAEAKQSGAVVACKLYPAGATTNSKQGVTDLAALDPVLQAMAEHGLVLCVHGEVTDPACDIFEREAAFVSSVLAPLVARHPLLRVVVEHMTTRDAVDFVLQAGPQVAGTVTVQHLLYNRNALFKGGLQPHMYCLPVLKREDHRAALLAAATSGSPKIFAGTDSAPHERGRKECPCGCAGIFSAHAAVELYAEAFEGAGALDKLEAFLCHHGADFYGLPRNEGEGLQLTKEDWTVPASYEFDSGVVVPLRAEQTVAWRLDE